jgi:p-hydroxybenzoate 3-monooxygenase
LQVPADEPLEAWPDGRIWAELQKRFALPGWSVSEGRITDKSITPMRSFVAGPMRHGRLFLAGDAAHIVPPCGAKGLNLAVGDAIVMASALSALLVDGSAGLADAYSDTCLRRAWRATHFSYFMTSMTHVAPDDPFDDLAQLAQLRYVTSSTAAATSLAENYSGYESPKFDPPG